MVHCKIHTFTEGLPDPGNSSESHVDPVLMELTVLCKEADVSKCLITAIERTAVETERRTVLGPEASGAQHGECCP